MEKHIFIYRKREEATQINQRFPIEVQQMFGKNVSFGVLSVVGLDTCIKLINCENFWCQECL